MCALRRHAERRRALSRARKLISVKLPPIALPIIPRRVIAPPRTSPVYPNSPRFQLHSAWCNSPPGAVHSAARLAQHDLGGAQELVLGHLEVKRRGPAADAAGAVIVRAVARAVPAVVVARVGDGHAAQVRAHAQHDEPAVRDGTAKQRGAAWKLRDRDLAAGVTERLSDG